MRASAGAPVPEFGHDKTPLVGGGCYRYRLWCLNAPGLSAWEQCSTVISKNVLSGADFFGRPTPTLPSRVLTFTKVACTVLTGPRHLQCSQHLQAAHCPASASSSWTWRRTLASIALFSGNRPGNQHCDANADFMATCVNAKLARACAYCSLNSERPPLLCFFALSLHISSHACGNLAVVWLRPPISWIPARIPASRACAYRSENSGSARQYEVF